MSDKRRVACTGLARQHDPIRLQGPRQSPRLLQLALQRRRHAGHMVARAQQPPRVGRRVKGDEVRRDGRRGQRGARLVGLHAVQERRRRLAEHQLLVLLVHHLRRWRAHVNGGARGQRNRSVRSRNAAAGLLNISSSTARSPPARGRALFNGGRAGPENSQRALRERLAARRAAQGCNHPLVHRVRRRPAWRRWKLDGRGVRADGRAPGLLAGLPVAPGARAASALAPQRAAWRR